MGGWCEINNLFNVQVSFFLFFFAGFDSLCASYHTNGTMERKPNVCDGGRDNTVNVTTAENKCKPSYQRRASVDSQIV